jgi:hypothetical protein
MTGVAEITNKIAVIVPTLESRQLYHSFISQYSGFEFHDYSSFEEFNLDTQNNSGFDGFIIDLRIILKADAEEKPFFYYIMDLFPTIRISHSPDMTTVAGDVRGRSFKNRELFDFFFLKQFERMEKGKINILLFVNEPETQVLYESRLQAYPAVEMHHYQSVQQCMSVITKRSRFSGIIVDLRTMMKANPGDRDSLHELMEVFPAMRISHSIDKLKVKGTIRDKNFEEENLFDFFFNDLCRNFLPKGIRCTKRYNLFLNVRLDMSQLLQPDVTLPPVSTDSFIRVNTVNISEDGLFIQTCIPLKEIETFTIIINELTDHTAIQCKLKWMLPWGESIHHLPGFGAEFTIIKPNQKEELAAILHRKSKPLSGV